MNDLLPQVAALKDDAVFRLGFRVLDWEAFAGPGLSSKAEWKTWAHRESADWSSSATPTAPVQGMAPILRRRADAADRLALEIAFRLSPQAGVPTVFSSRHGQVTRSAAMLRAQALGEPASPMDFSLSVHNATAGQYSIASGDKHASSSLSSRHECFAAGLLEAMGMLAEGAHQVLLVSSDPVMPEIYGDAEQGEPAGYSFGLLLGCEGGEAFSLALRTREAHATAADANPDRFPQALAFLRMLAGEKPSCAWLRSGRGWTWSRDAADAGV